MTNVRQPAVAWIIYPADPGELREMVRSFLAEAGSNDSFAKTIISFHAGFIYSGPIAANAYTRLAVSHARIERLIAGVVPPGAFSRACADR